MKRIFKNHLLVMMVVVMSLIACLGVFTGCSNRSLELEKYKSKCAELEEKVDELEKSNEKLEKTNEVLVDRNEELREGTLYYSNMSSILSNKMETLSYLYDYLVIENNYYRYIFGDEDGKESNFVGTFYDFAVGSIDEDGKYNFTDTFNNDYYMFSEELLPSNCSTSFDKRSFGYAFYTYDGYDNAFLIQYDIYSVLDEEYNTVYVPVLKKVLTYENYTVKSTSSYKNEEVKTSFSSANYVNEYFGFLKNVTFSVDEDLNSVDVQLEYVCIGKIDS